MEKDWLKLSGMHDGASPDKFEFAASLRKSGDLLLRKIDDFKFAIYNNLREDTL